MFPGSGDPLGKGLNRASRYWLVHEMFELLLQCNAARTSPEDYLKSCGLEESQ